MLIVMDSFQTYHNWDGNQIPSAGGGKWTVRNGGGLGSSAGGVNARFAGSSHMAFANGAYLGKLLAVPRDELILGGGYSSNVGAGSVITIHQFWDGATIQATITAQGDDSIALRRGDKDGPIVAQSAAGVYTRNAAWSGLSYRTKISPAAGEFQVWKNGGSVYNVGGLNNRASGTSQITEFYLSGVSGNPGFYVTISDFYCFDTTTAKNNAFPGDVRIRTLRPNADTATKDWTILGGTAGSHFYRVATPNVLDDSYAGGEYTVRSNVVGQVDRWDLENFAGFTGTIPAVALTYRALKNDAGARQMLAGIQSGGVDADGATVNLGTSALNYYNQFELDPNGNIDWALAAVNAAKAYVKMVA